MPFYERSRRFQTEKLPVSLRVAGTFVWSRGMVLNLSSTGLQIFTSVKLRPGDVLEVEFNTVNRQGVKTRRRMKAVIVWAKAQRYGCEFTRPS